MPTIEAAIVDQCVNDMGTGGVNTLIAGRVYPEPAPAKQNLYPRIVFTPDDRETDQVYSGPSGFVKQKVTLACQARQSPQQMATLSAAVLALFNGKKGTWGGIQVLGCFLQDERTTEVTTDLNNKMIIYSRELDFLFCFNS